MRTGLPTATPGRRREPARVHANAGTAVDRVHHRHPRRRHQVGCRRVHHPATSTPPPPITVEALVNGTAGRAPLVELYTHMVHRVADCRVLQVDLFARTWRLGHYTSRHRRPHRRRLRCVARRCVPVDTAPRRRPRRHRTVPVQRHPRPVHPRRWPPPTRSAHRPMSGSVSSGRRTSRRRPQVRSFKATGLTYRSSLGGTAHGSNSSPQRRCRAHRGPSAGRVVINYDPTKPRPDAPTITAPPRVRSRRSRTPRTATPSSRLTQPGKGSPSTTTGSSTTGRAGATRRGRRRLERRPTRPVDDRPAETPP